MPGKKNIELRSEKVRSIIGHVPSVLLRYGIALIGIILILLVGMAAFIPYKETISISAKVETSPKSVLLKATRAGQILWDSKSIVVREGDVLGYELAQDGLYAVKTSLSGKFFCIVQNGDVVSKGMTLAVITPQNDLTYYALATIPQSLLTKIQQGEKVLFNSTEGIIVGIVAGERPVLEANTDVLIRIVFEDKFPQAIVSKTIMNGKIIISEKSFLERFWDSL